MLTTKVITPKQGESYYAKENYYSAEESVENSQWFGKGARDLGLRGQVKPKDFKKLLYGELPNGTKFRNRNPDNPKNKERAGVDCTFSAPKSVSILALVGGEEQVEQAHKKAVKRTLKIIERDYAATRVKKNYQSRVVNTGNLVVGQFHHDTSRELDPHLHTHCVVLNMTKYKNKWYAFRNDGVHANKKMLGMIYQNELAIEVQKLGYEIEPKENGQFEIKGFKEQDLESLSKRRQQIKAQLRHDSTWKDREKIWDQTRIKKGEPIPREELQAYWQQELSDAPFPQPVPEQAKEYKKQLRTAAISAKGAVAEAIEHSSERNVAFKPEALKKFILEDVGKYSHELLHNQIANNNELIHLDKKVTTQTALLREINTIRLVKDGQEQVEALSTSEAITDSVRGLGLTSGQQNAVVMAATTNDQIIAWQGKAGVGKTYALNTFKTIAQNAGYTIKGFAPSAKAAGILSEEMDINATTVARKLVSLPLDEEAEQQQIWIVDEAGLLGAKDAHELLQKAKAENARVLLVGDTRQLSSVAAGNPFKSLQQAGMATAFMNQSLRQKTKDLKQAVNLLSDGHIAEGIKILETNKRIEEIADESERVHRIASDYLKLTPQERKQTLVIAGTNQERTAILDSIRNRLKAEGSLGKSITAKRLKSKNLTNVQKNYAHNYDVNNVVIPLANRKRLGLEKNRRYLVKAVDRKTDSLVLIDNTGTEKRVSPADFRYKEVYEISDTDIAVGDRLRWGKNDKELNRTNGEEFTVTGINDDGIATITTESGKSEQINLKKLQHLDHALVSTTYSSQGSTSNKVLVSITNDLTLSQESFYVAASRAKYNLSFYVEDKASLIENASKSHAQKNPLELIREHQGQVAVAVETVATAEPEFKPTPSPQKPKPILRNEKEVMEREPELEITSSQQEEVNEEEADITTPVSPEELTKPQPLATPAPRHYNALRDTSLVEVAERLGLQPDLHTPNFYKVKQVYAISINNESFFDHIAQKGGGGAIDLVMHVNGSNFRDAVDWLNGSTISFTPSISKQHTQPKTIKPEVKKEPFTPPVPDESKWFAVKDYLVNTRGIDERIIDHLHQRGSVYADEQQNAVFLKKNAEGKVTGASLRGTYNDSKFKGLAKATERDAGWFAHTGGKSKTIERIILTKSPIDALSAATLSQKPETTLYLSIDGNGALPEDYLKQKLREGKQVIVGFDNDQAGENAAQQILEQLPGSVRVAPRIGKDWNERLLLYKNPIEEEKWLLRQEYKQLSQQVRSNPDFTNAPVEQVDKAVALLIIKNSIEQKSTQDPSGKVSRILSQSDKVLDWKKTMPDPEHRALTEQYVVDTFNSATATREATLEERQQQKQQQNQGFDLEM